MKQLILNIILAVMVIFLGATTVWLFVVNHTQKKTIDGLKETLKYEEQLIDDLRSANTSTETEQPETLIITSSEAEPETKDGEEEITATSCIEPNDPKEEDIKKVDLSNMETVKAHTKVSPDQIDKANLEQYFKAFPISDALFERIHGDDKSYKLDCDIPLEHLSYIKVLHYDYDGNIRVGEMIVNYLLVEDVLYIFQKLFENKYQIEKMYLVEKYGADDDTSVNNNNTSCFNYRPATDASILSNHATGCAIDINPLQNPYFRIMPDGDHKWDNTGADNYWDRTNDPKGRHMINTEDLCYQLFTERGFAWGGLWANPIDYQHFEKPIY